MWPLTSQKIWIWDFFVVIFCLSFKYSNIATNTNKIVHLFLVLSRLPVIPVIGLLVSIQWENFCLVLPCIIRQMSSTFIFLNSLISWFWNHIFSMLTLAAHGSFTARGCQSFASISGVLITRHSWLPHLSTYQMYEPSSCEPCAYEDGTQVHQLDGIAGWKKKRRHKSLKDPNGKKKKNHHEWACESKSSLHSRQITFNLFTYWWKKKGDMFYI